MADQLQVIRLHNKFPKLTASQLAGRLSCMPEYIRATGRRCGLSLPGAKTLRVRNDGLVALGRAARAAGLTIDDIDAIAAAKRAKRAPNNQGGV